MGEPCCEARLSTSSRLFPSQPCSTLTMAYDRRVRSSRDSCKRSQISKRQTCPRQPTSATLLLPVEGKLGLRAFPDSPPTLSPTPSPPGLFDILICPLLVLFGAATESKVWPAVLGVCAVDFEVTVRDVSASAPSEAANEQCWPRKLGVSCLERPEDEVGGVTSESLASA